MSRNTKDFLCLISCGAAMLLSLVTTFSTGVSVAEINKDNEALREIILSQEEKLTEQDKTIEDYKIYVDNIARNITEGVW